MKKITITLVYAGGTKELQLLQDFAPKIARHVNAQGGMFGAPIHVEIIPVKDRSAPVALELAKDLIQRNDILAVLFWGGTWLGKRFSKTTQDFLLATAAQPFIVLSGTTHSEHHQHPGSFSIAPFQRDKSALLRQFINDLPQKAMVAYVGKTIPELHHLRKAVAESHRTLDEVVLPDSANTQDPSEDDYASLVYEMEQKPQAHCWLLGTGALNRPLRTWLRARYPQAVIVSLNTGKALDWFKDDSKVGDIFFGQEGNRERPDVQLTNLFQLTKGFPREKMDSILLLQQASKLVRMDAKTSSRQELFSALRLGLLQIDGKNEVFVGSRYAFWFDPATRNSLSGSVCLKRRLNVGNDSLLYAKQYVQTSSGELQPLPVLFLNIDLLSIDFISIEDKKFQAKFYMDMRSLHNLSISDIQFLNLAEDQAKPDLLIEATDTEEGERIYVKRYLFSETFTFTPKMACYPFDTQLIDIELAPANPLDKNFMIQPAPREKQDRNYEVSGWTITGAELSSHTNFWTLPVDSSFNTEHRSFSAVSFGWLLQRISKDTIMLVAVPMAVLLGITFFAVFARLEDVPSKVTELTQTMLAVIALYFATTKPKTGEMTILDLVFRVAYIIIGGLLGTFLISSTFFPAAYDSLMKVWLLLFPTIIIHQVYYARKIYRQELKLYQTFQTVATKKWSLFRWKNKETGQ